jgi:hypothetical protein
MDSMSWKNTGKIIDTPEATDKGEKEKWHTKKWYKEHFGVNVEKLGLPHKEVKNPHYSSGSPMKLWKEEDVLPYKNEKGIKQFQKRSEAGKKGFQKRREKLIKLFKEIKEENPDVGEITKRLWEIGNRIGELHGMKENCRDYDADKKEYFDWGMEHCDECARMSDEQHELRGERQELFEKLESIYNVDKRKLQLMRKYYREEKANKFS